MNKIFSSKSGLVCYLDRQGLRHSDKRNTSDGTNKNCCRNTMRSFLIYLFSSFFYLTCNLVILRFVRNEFELLEEIDFQTDQYECLKKKPATEENTVSASIETPP